MVKNIILLLCYSVCITCSAFGGECLPIDVEKTPNISNYDAYIQIYPGFVFCGIHYDKIGKNDNKGCDNGDVVETKLGELALCQYNKWKKFFVNQECEDDLQTVINTHNSVSYMCDDGVICYGNTRTYWAIDADSLCKYDYDKFDSLDRECFTSGGSSPYEDIFCHCDTSKKLVNDGPYKCKCMEENKEYSWDLDECVTKSFINNESVNKISESQNCSGSEHIGENCVCNDSNKELKNGKCEFSEAYLDKLRQDITDKYSKIKSLSNTFEVSKWKNEDGKFNTARLASDSIAGVVLGTVGGVVTAHVVKKNQLKKGFEDLQCYIGGQSVADWGDGFVVGN